MKEKQATTLGTFDDSRKEFIIHTPDLPHPWINYLGTEDFYSLISHTAGGYCFYKDARLRRITRYRYNNIPLDNDGRTFFLHDGTRFWSPTVRPMRIKPDFFECRHGLGYTVITTELYGLRVETLFFVPLKANVEIHHMTLTNLSSSRRNLDLYSFIEFCLWNAFDDMTNFQRNFSTGEVEVDQNASTIYHKTEFRERRNHYAFHSVNAPLVGFDTDRKEFIGINRGLESPQVLEDNVSRNSLAHGWSPVSSHHLRFSLESGEKRDFIFLLGYVEVPPDKKWSSKRGINKEPAEAIKKEFATKEQIQRSLETLGEYWDERLSRFRASTGIPALDRSINIWNPYQCMTTFNFSRSASYFESGIGRGMGFRDSAQDILGFVHMEPTRTRIRLLDLASTQLENGHAYHQYQPLTRIGNNEIGSGFNDDPLWLVLAATSYIKETGDFSILSEPVRFDCGRGSTAPFFEHLRRAIVFTIDHKGPHGLPLIGRADWNDCLNLNCFSETPDEPFQTTGPSEGPIAESLMIAGLFLFVAPDFIQLCRITGRNELAEFLEKETTKFRTAVEEHGWDGQWFLRAFDATGKRVGSHLCPEGKIFIESQAFCVMAGVGLNDGRAEKALSSAKTHLDTPFGSVLVEPAYTRYDKSLGEITSYPPGYKENGGVFCHNNPWLGIAETIVGHGNRAFDIYQRITPTFFDEKRRLLHKVEPYVYCQMISGKAAALPGEGKNSWLTGSAAWNYVLITQRILGIRPSFDGLVVDPCVPAHWKRFTVERFFRNGRYKITVLNPDGLEKGRIELKVDGHPVPGNTIPIVTDPNRPCYVTARMIPS
ncbi:MAG: glycosyl transferase [Candidatus Hydrogenedentota bacterium]|nr:MAG: glycosyl transferase [Candidatus Hydrogenedentota bacterium]